MLVSTALQILLCSTLRSVFFSGKKDSGEIMLFSDGGEEVITHLERPNGAQVLRQI